MNEMSANTKTFRMAEAVNGHCCLKALITGLHLTGMHLMSVHRIGMYPIGAYLISVDVTCLYFKGYIF
jgi:hypothetical protein